MTFIENPNAIALGLPWVTALSFWVVWTILRPLDGSIIKSMAMTRKIFERFVMS
jgi:hypothetical protein